MKNSSYKMRYNQKSETYTFFSKNKDEVTKSGFVFRRSLVALRLANNSIDIYKNLKTNEIALVRDVLTQTAGVNFIQAENFNSIVEEYEDLNEASLLGVFLDRFFGTKMMSD